MRMHLIVLVSGFSMGFAVSVLIFSGLLHRSQAQTQAALDVAQKFERTADAWKMNYDACETFVDQRGIK